MNLIIKEKKKFKEAKKELGFKERKLNAIQNLITEQVEELNVLLDNIQSMISHIAENLQMESKVNSQKRTIRKKLQDDIIAEENKEVSDERDKFLKEIVDIEKENKGMIERSEEHSIK